MDKQEEKSEQSSPDHLNEFLLGEFEDFRNLKNDRKLGMLQTEVHVFPVQKYDNLNTGASAQPLHAIYTLNDK